MNLFAIKWKNQVFEKFSHIILAFLNPDPDPDSESGSNDPFESGSTKLTIWIAD
jgi:hypothetical protein